MHATRSKGLIGAAGVAALALPALATAAKPAPGPSVTLGASPTTIVYSKTTALSGRLAGGQAGGVTVRFEQDSTRPYGDAYQPSGLSAKTAANGKFSVAAKPLANTQYRAIADTSPQIMSAPRLVLVRTLVGLKVTDPTPPVGGQVRFSGSVYPASAGRIAIIQKRSPSGRFVSVTRVGLVAAGTRSTYSRSIAVRRDATYRVKVVGDSDHVNGFSRTVAINVAG